MKSEFIQMSTLFGCVVFFSLHSDSCHKDKQLIITCDKLETEDVPETNVDLLN